MKNAFLSELPFVGRIPDGHSNMRVEFAWMTVSDAVHHNIWQYDTVQGYDQVFVIIPKGKFSLNVEGSPVVQNFQNPISPLLSQPLISTLKENNARVFVVQEGPSWMFNDWSVTDQVNWFNEVGGADGILCHNEWDYSFFKGLFPHLGVAPIPSMMVIPERGLDKTLADKGVLVGGNFSRWYGGFQSYVVAKEFGLEIEIPTSHSRREDEGLIGDIRHIPRLDWLEWMEYIGGFKYGVHLMPTVAAGTFSLNMGYWGIPTIGNKMVDTQRILFPDLSVHPEDVAGAAALARKLRDDAAFRQYCSDYALDKVGGFIWSRRDGGTIFDDVMGVLR